MPGDWEAAELMRGMQGASSALAVCGVTYGAQSLRFKAETCCLPGMSLNLFFFFSPTHLSAPCAAGGETCKGGERSADSGVLPGLYSRKTNEIKNPKHK